MTSGPAADGARDAPLASPGARWTEEEDEELVAAVRAEGAENLCHLGKGPAERGRAFGMRRAGLGPTGGGMIFGLWA